MLEELFRGIDDGDGVLTPEELVELEKKFNNDITIDEAEEIIKTWDCTGDGRMTVGEFIEYKTATISFQHK